MIDWKNINDGYSGFENLAFKYVEAEFQFPDVQWKQTKKTHDNNRDAYTIIVGFHPYADMKETWWMEAKYSHVKGREYLTRYRLDATIVSSAFYRKISKIIFVTNLSIHSKNISDIRFALKKSTDCDEVYFCTKDVIEYWLIQNPDIYRDFWGAPLKISIDHIRLFVSEEVIVYPYPSDGYVEKCNIIYFGKNYQAYFKIVSPTDQEVSLEPARKGIVLETTSLKLNRGENVVNAIFHFADNFQIIDTGTDGRECICLDIFKISNKEVVRLKNHLEILKSTDLRLQIQSQEVVLSELLTVAKSFQQERKLQFAIIYGESGTGKSYVVDQLRLSKPMHSEMVFYHNFSRDQVENAKQVLNMLFFLLFPYVNPYDVDSSYLEEISQNIKITQDFIQLASCRDHPAELEKAFQCHYNRRGNILPQQCELNTRYLLLDNFQNLSPIILSFLSFLFRELKQKKCPFLFIFTGQSYILESDFYHGLKEEYEITELECRVDDEDIISNLQAIMSFQFDIPNSTLSDYFPNLIILIEFLQYIYVSSIKLHNMDDFLELYMPFVNGEMGKAMILDRFSNIMGNNKFEKLCHAIYTTPNGVALEGGNYAAASALINTGLVKLNEQNRLIPFHDIFENIFRRTHHISKKKLGLDYTDEVDEARDKLLFSNHLDDILWEAKRVSQLRREGHFYSVCYILDGYFHNTHSQSAQVLLKSSKYQNIYYQLYFDYAYAATNCSRRDTGYDYFDEIYKEIKSKTSFKMRLLKLELLFELMNSNYNIFQYAESMRCYRDFQETLSLLKRSGTMHAHGTEYIMSILCENMRILIQSSRGKKRSKRMFERWIEVLANDASLQHHCIDFYVRYAHTLYTVNIDRAFAYTKEAHTLLPGNTEKTSKIWCLVEFQYIYLRFLIEKDHTLLPDIENIVDAACRDYYSSYRHRNLALCSILYFIKDVKKADERFFRDKANPRRLRNKLKGFYYETFALHYLAHGNTEEASAVLQRASEIFQSVRSYLRVVHHNQKVLKRGYFSSERVDFYTGEPLKRDYYYIDPRAD